MKSCGRCVETNGRQVVDEPQCLVEKPSAYPRAAMSRIDKHHRDPSERIFEPKSCDASDNLSRIIERDSTAIGVRSKKSFPVGSELIPSARAAQSKPVWYVIGPHDPQRNRIHQSDVS